METRRNFIKTATAASVGLTTSRSVGADKNNKGTQASKSINKREYGRSNEKVTELCVGGFHIGNKPAGLAEKLIEQAIDEGIRFFDTARTYQSGTSEKHYGKFLTPKYRDQIHLLSKSEKETGKEARAALDTSFKLLKTDHLDTWLVHAITSEKDVENRFNNGVLDTFVKAKEDGLVKNIGFSGHSDFKAHLRMLELLDKHGIKVDSCLMPINLVDPHYRSFITNVLPELQKRNISILAMKTLAFGRMLGAGPERLNKTKGKPKSMENDGVGVKEMHSYVYSLPISTLISGFDKPEQVTANANISRAFKGMAEDEQNRLVAIAKKYSGNITEHYKK